MNTPVKHCSKCKQEKPCDEFYKHPTSKSGFTPACKQCTQNGNKRWASNNPDKVNAVKRRYLERHPDRRKESVKRYRDNHKQECDRRIKEWKNRNRDKVNGYAQKSYRADPEKFRQRAKLYNERNPHTRRNYVRNHPHMAKVIAERRLARKQSLPDNFTAADWQHALSYFNGCCAVCGRPAGLWHTLAMDHWIPLSSSNCTGTIPKNIIPLCHYVDGCNNSKGSKNAEAWLVEKFGKSKAKKILARIQAYFDSLD